MRHRSFAKFISVFLFSPVFSDGQGVHLQYEINSSTINLKLITYGRTEKQRNRRF